MTNDPIAEAIAAIDERWPEAVERAKQWQPGMMRSVWTMPIERLVQDREHVMRELGVDPSPIKPPKSMGADADEKALPEHVRAAYRRGRHLHTRMQSAYGQHQRKAQRRGDSE